MLDQTLTGEVHVPIIVGSSSSNQQPSSLEKERGRGKQQPSSLEKERGQGLHQLTSLEKERGKGTKGQKIQESPSTSLGKDRGRNRKKIVKTLSTEEVDDIFNYEDVNVDHNNSEEPRSNNVFNSNASQRNREMRRLKAK